VLGLREEKKMGSGGRLWFLESPVFCKKKKKGRIEGVLAVCRGKWGFLVMEMRGHGLGEKEKRWPRGAVASFEKMKD
jgi:hypothetical protein